MRDRWAPANAGPSRGVGSPPGWRHDLRFTQWFGQHACGREFTLAGQVNGAASAAHTWRDRPSTGLSKMAVFCRERLQPTRQRGALSVKWPMQSGYLLWKAMAAV